MARPDPERIRTSHAERQSLSMRMAIRRFTRLTNAFSKKWENNCVALMLWFAFCNSCWVHRMPRVIPDMAAEVSDHIWSARGLLEAA